MREMGVGEMTWCVAIKWCVLSAVAYTQDSLTTKQGNPTLSGQNIWGIVRSGGCSVLTHEAPSASKCPCTSLQKWMEISVGVVQKNCSKVKLYVYGGRDRRRNWFFYFLHHGSWVSELSILDFSGEEIRFKGPLLDTFKVKWHKKVIYFKSICCGSFYYLIRVGSGFPGTLSPCSLWSCPCTGGPLLRFLVSLNWATVLLSWLREPLHCDFLQVPFRCKWEFPFPNPLKQESLGKSSYLHMGWKRRDKKEWYSWECHSLTAWRLQA